MPPGSRLIPLLSLVCTSVMCINLSSLVVQWLRIVIVTAVVQTP